ncbi:hypothetical protein CHISP_2164 [Chitinispirillum alkaliphilum]|nr:hypothetical protein CHISP_2164 [Chitinispirillum alkaliphilum]
MRIVVFLVAAQIFLGCNMFNLLEPEYPDSDGLRFSEDPFNFSQILAGSGEHLKTQNYEELFSEDFLFESSAFSVVYTKDKLLEILEHLTVNSFDIEWSSGAANYRGDALILSGVEYDVYINGVLSYSGTAEFRLIKGLEWKIEHWKDIPYDESNPFFK